MARSTNQAWDPTPGTEPPGFRTVLDLSWPLTPGMPHYPGSPPPRFEAAATVPADGFAETRLTLLSHTGTHLEAPAHLLPGGRTLSDYPPGHFFGRAAVLDLGTTPPDLGAWDRALAGCAFAVLRTGWSRLWGTPAYFDGFPTLAPDAARWLAALGLRGVGVDAVSMDPVTMRELPVHRILLGAGLILVENLADLALLPAVPFWFSCLPLSLAGADGSPVRAVAGLW